MYTFQANAGRRRDRNAKRLLLVIIFLLAIALAGVSYSFIRARGMEDRVGDAVYACAVSEAENAQSAVYHLTQSSGTNTSNLLSIVRGHIYALQSLNDLAAGIYGPGTAVTDEALLDACVETIDSCDARLQAGLVYTDLLTDLRDQVELVVGTFER